MNYSKELLNLISQSPYKVVFSSGLVEGECDIYNKTIRISNSLSLETEEKILILVHEIGHATCKINGCICLQEYPKLAALAELHAYMYVLNYCYNNKHKKLLSMLIRSLMWHAGRKTKTCHTIAIKQIVKYKLFNECIKMANSQKQLLLFS